MISPNSIGLDVQLLHPEFMCYTGIIILIFGILFTLFLRKYHKKKQKRNLIIAIISCAVIISAGCFEIFLYNDYQYHLHYNILEYTLDLESKSDKFEEVFAPISVNNDLKNSLKIRSGKGTISIINSDQGLALKINFSGKIKIDGKIDTTSGIGKHDLSMVNQTGKRHSIEYWIFYKPSSSFNYNCSFKFKLFHESLDWWETHYCEGFLSEGWNTYWGTEGAES